MCQRLPKDFEEKLGSFQCYVIGLRHQHGYNLGQMGNAVRHARQLLSKKLALKTGKLGQQVLQMVDGLSRTYLQPEDTAKKRSISCWCDRPL